MPSSYPGGLDNFNNPTAADNLSDAPVLHTAQHTNVNDAVKAIETELGTNPKGVNTSVRARLEAIEAAQGGFQVTTAKGAANGYAGLDAGGMLAQNIDAGKITAGSVAVARIPNLSGAKILGTGSGGAAIPLDAVPNLPAARTTSGVFDIARIPTIPLATGVSGILPAGMIPSSVTSNANSKVVADVAGRDAIALVDRVDGMIVTVRSPWTQYTWRADNSTWNQSGGPGAISEPPLEAYEGTALTTSTTTFNAGAPGHSQVFTAPKSGQVYITVSSLLIITVGTGSGYLAAEVRAGAVIGSGTVIDAAVTQKAVSIGGAALLRNGSSYRYLVPGLTSGSQYHVRTMFTTSASPTCTMQIFYRRVLVEMVH